MLEDEPRIARLLELLAERSAKLEWKYTSVSAGGCVEKSFAWPGPPEDDIMICVHRGAEIRGERFHRQDFFFLDFAYSGDYSALSEKNDNVVTVRENECYIGQPFSGYALVPHGGTVVGVLIQKEAFFKTFLPAFAADTRLFRFFLGPQTNEYSDEFIRLRFDDPRRVRALVEMMVEEYAEPREDTQAVLQPLALALLMLAARCRRSSAPAPADETPAGKIIRYMSEHAGAATLKGIAAHFSYHPNYVSGLLRRATGRTFSEMLLEQRMRRAASLLCGTRLPVEDVALMLGYANSSNFYKAFREYYGKSPREYMKDA